MKIPAMYSLRCVVILGLTLSGCNGRVGLTGTTTTNNSDATTPRAPAALAPVWLSKAEVERLDKSGMDPADSHKLDAFVLLAAGKEGVPLNQSVAGTALYIKMMLHRLYYDVDLAVEKHPYEDPKFYAALTEFEQRAGLKQDGVFSAGELEVLQHMSSLANYYDLQTMPLGTKYFGQQDGYITAQGTWVIQNDKLAAPINTAKIECWRSFGNCIVVDANLKPPSQSDFGDSFYITSDVSYYSIKSWSATRVIAEQTTICRRLVLTVDVGVKQAYYVTDDLTSQGCPVLGKMSAPRVTTLEDGVNVGLEHYKDTWAQLEKVSKYPRGRLQQLWETTDQNKGVPASR